MPKNVMKQLKPKANIGRNAFDLSHRSVFTANFGELLPCCCIETVPSNDEIIIRPADLVRALPLATSPFLRAKQHIDFWFVPYSAIWTRFNEFMVDRDEPASAALNSRTYLPYVSLDDFRLVLSDSGLQYRDIVGRPYTYGANKLLNLLGYGIADDFVGDDNDVIPKVNLFRLCAYNYIWYKEYRQQYYDTGLHLMPHDDQYPSAVARLWNLDDVRCGSVDAANIVRERCLNELRAMTQLRYRCYKKDLFTGLMPSQQYGDVSVIKGSLNGDLGTPTYDTDGVSTIEGFHPLSTEDGYTVSGSSSAASAQVFLRNTGISVLDLRKAEAVQRWRENALRAGNQVEDNFEAHYGAKPRSHMIQHPIFIGSFDAPLNIGDVVSTAQTGDGENQSLGDIAGKGLSSVNGNKITFKTNDFGVIIGMFSLLPETEYNATGIDRMNQLLEREDFFIPEYERLGLEPVDAFTFYSSYHGDAESRKGIVGFAPRYWGYKQKLDKCYGEMQHTRFKTGMFAHWCSPKDDVESAIMSMNNDGVFPLSVLYVNPAIFDINFNVSVENADQFLVDMFNEVTAIRGMSVSGMPAY